MKVSLSSTPLLPHLRKDVAEQALRDMTYHFWPMIGTANQVAQQAMLECHDMLQERGLLRREVKQNVKRAIDVWDSYLRRAKYELGDRWFLSQDLITHAAARFDSDVTKLRYSIKQLFDRHKVKDSDLRAWLFTASALIKIAVMVYDSYISHFQKMTVYDFRSEFSAARLDKASHAWDKVVDSFSDAGVGLVDPNSDHNIKLAIRIIMTRYSTTDIFNDAAGEAIKLNPDMIKYVKDE